VTAPRRIRVLVVDDSAFARKVLRETLQTSPALEVVGIARDGLEALEKIAELAPDVVTLDLIMPNLDGLGVLRALPAGGGGPRVVVVSISDGNSVLGIDALRMGAVDLVQKPTALATDRLYELGAELVAKVIAAAGARVPAAASAEVARAPSRPSSGRVKLVVIGTSTGGPQALTSLLPALPGNLPCAVAVALHIPVGYTPALAHRLDEACALRVVEAVNGAPLAAGEVVIAPGGLNLRIEGSAVGLRARVDVEGAESMFRPSVDRLFESAAATLGTGVLGVVLTGMGDDGLAGAREIRRLGGRVLTEAEESCVVYGMPRAVAEAGFSDGVVRLGGMAEAIVGRL
jgi:two-component system, chemotaxis family, protein-glutamate methylesterase/glutaminase